MAIAAGFANWVDDVTKYRRIGSAISNALNSSENWSHRCKGEQAPIVPADSVGMKYYLIVADSEKEIWIQADGTYW